MSRIFFALLVISFQIIQRNAQSEPEGGFSQDFLSIITKEAGNTFEKFDPASSKVENYANQQFYCPSFISTYPRPSSVHRLRPNDVEVIGAIGDSLTAANGAKALTLLGVILEDRGVSWAIGGEKADLNKLVTLPNILRKFNPNIYGFSTATAGVGSNLAGFNLAFPGDTSYQMLTQAKLLVERMQSSDRIDFKNQWKLVTIFAGGNDLCRSCKNAKLNAESYVRNIRNTLDYFHDNLPRTLINLVLTLDVSGIETLDGVVCRKLHNCGISVGFRDRLREITVGMQRGIENLISSGRYDIDDQFTVVVQPFMKETRPPTYPDGSTDYSYFAPDCFHFSAKGHAAAAIELWKSMISPVGSKPVKWTNLEQPIPCPTFPYIYTNKNSVGSIRIPADTRLAINLTFIS